MTDIWIVVTWAALACAITVIGRMLGNERVVGVGAVMALFTCAFAC